MCDAKRTTVRLLPILIYMGTDTAAVTVPAPDPEFPLWRHVASVLESEGDPADKVADGLSAAFLAVIDPDSTHGLTDAFVSTVESVISSVTGRHVELPGDTSCQLNAVLQVAIEAMLETP